MLRTSSRRFAVGTTTRNVKLIIESASSDHRSIPSLACRTKLQQRAGQHRSALEATKECDMNQGPGAAPPRGRRTALRAAPPKFRRISKSRSLRDELQPACQRAPDPPTQGQDGRSTRRETGSAAE